jgi:RNA polymerase sigma factor (sigma-70 family)
LPRLKEGKTGSRNQVGERDSEAYLVLKAQQGDRYAFEALYRSYQPSLMRFAYRLCKHSDMATDAVQDAWVTTARTLGSLYEPDMFRARIFKAVRWRCLDILRKQSSGQISYEEAEEYLAAPDAPLWATKDQLIALIERLPFPERQAVYLFYLEEMKIDEIGLVMDVPPGTVKSRLNRARKRLSDQVKGEENALD